MNLQENMLPVLIRVRGFPLRDILSLRALGYGLGQGRKIVGAPSSPSPSASVGILIQNAPNIGKYKLFPKWACL